MSVFSVIRLPDLLSILNALLGLGAIWAASRDSPGVSMLLIILAAAADGLDGFLARRFGAGPLGVNLDSFADLVSFGVAPAAFALIALELPWPAMAIEGVYLACGMLRLARFNISPKNNQFFEGLPIPPCGIAVAASVLLGWPEFTLILMLILSIFMISNVPFPKIRSFQSAAPLIMVSLATATLTWMKNDLNYTTVLLYPTITALMIYAVSPVVMPFLRKER